MNQQLGNRYDLLELIGEGGMGAVYRARDRELDDVVALKLIRDDLASDPQMIERFRREVKLARRVTHANVARTFELGSADGHVFCTMELVEGEPLTTRLARDHKLKVGEAVAIASSVCDGLAAAHAAGVIHRDIKPDNILLANDGRVVLADFGVAALHTGDRGELSGTPAYMAPEQARGEPVSPATDVYAVGLVLFEMITGRRAFAGAPAQVLADKQTFDRMAPPAGDAAPELAEVIGRATARDLANRLASASELRRALSPWARSARLETQPPPADDGDRGLLATIVVLAPRGDTKLYLAEAVYEELLARLTREPRVRVLSREDAIEPGAVLLHLTAGETLGVRAERDGRTLVAVEVPLAVDRIAAEAEALYRTLYRLAAPRPDTTDARVLEATDLALQARHNVRRGLEYSQAAAAQVARAYELCPDDPRVLATIAIVTSRRAFFLQDTSEDAMTRASTYARAAVAAAPERVDSHLALGMVELNSGNPLAAAREYRAAIACSPHAAEAHEYMGRMLLEAGYLDEARARLDAAIAINPSRKTVYWELGRAEALEGHWDEYERLIAEAERLGFARPFARTRAATWQRRVDLEPVLAPELAGIARSFAPGLTDSLADAYLHGAWSRVRDALVGLASTRWPNRRRRTWVAQLVSEAAAYNGDHECATTLIAGAIADGLFDRHWLEKCPLLDSVRASPRYPQLHALVARQAEGVLDAMYGDHDLGTSDTAIATS